VLPPNAPGRDAIVTRIIQLRGLEASNSNAYARGIYIHGTPEEKTIGRPVSYGCIRMKSTDVTALYNQIPIGATVQIVQDKFPALVPQPNQPSTSGIFASSNGKAGPTPTAQAVTAAKPASSTPPTRKSASLLLATASRGGA
jgi:lipoprotein-anchoring transpeptidase ErfK/SrfK